MFTPSDSMLLDKYLHNRKRLKCKYKYVNFYCKKESDIVATFRSYAIAELTLETGDSRHLIGQQSAF
jgi:hypothetical protein